MSTNFNMESAIKMLEMELKERGSFAILDKGFEILPNEYHDFGCWLFDDREYFEHEMLSRIGGYAPSKEIQENKCKLYEYVKTSAIGEAWELPKLRFYQEVPMCSYEECRKEVYVVVEQKHKEQWEQLFEWSKNFRKFTCKPLSESFLRTRNKKELKLFCHGINYRILEKVFILYSHEARIMILRCILYFRQQRDFS